MRTTPLLIEAKPLDAYSVRVRFEDGVTADVDLSFLAERGGVFEPLKDLDFFRRLRADPEAGTIGARQLVDEASAEQPTGSDDPDR